MSRRVKDGASLALHDLVALAIPVCREAQRLCPRTGPGRKPDFEDWQLCVIVLCGVMKKKKSKSAQYRLAAANADLLGRLLGLDRFPSRSTFFDRYKRLWPLVQRAIELQGRVALREHVADAQTVAADKSLAAARGPQWNQKDRKAGRVPPKLRGLDRDADWGKSDYHGWVYGYSYEVAVTATAGSVVLPLLASVDVASANEHRTFPPKIDRLPPSNLDLLVDAGYDGNDPADRYELDPGRRRCCRGPEQARKRTRATIKGRGQNRRRQREPHYVCPPQKGFVSAVPERGLRERQRRRRVKRLAFLRSRRGRALYARRKQTVEPFHGTFKAMFELGDHMWHRGLDNNRTCVLTAIFAYQLLIRAHWKRGGRDAQIQYILDGL
jgi:hypothetical protein